MNGEDKARHRREERKRLLERLNSRGEGAPYVPEADESERIRKIEIERNRRPEPGTAGGFASSA